MISNYYVTLYPFIYSCVNLIKIKIKINVSFFFRKLKTDLK